MKAPLFLATAAFLSAQAHAQVSGFMQLRSVQRAGSAPGCASMVQEGLAELFFEKGVSADLALSVRGEALQDAISRDQKAGLREATIAWQSAPDVDIKIGRQIITWGVSDYLYVNDVFPKNYDVFFSGGSFDRIKVPVDAARATWHGSADVELVISKPKADRMPSPARFTAVGLAATAVPAAATGTDADAALKASAHLGGWDLAGYAASIRSRELRNFMDESGLLRSDQPRLHHLGVSLTGNAASGVVWVEAALRHFDANAGRVVDRHFLGSSTKFIAGYSREIADEVTASAQVQIESALDRNQYVNSLAPGIRPVPQFSPIVHLRVHGRWVNQTIGAGAQLFAGAEGDTHFNPFLSWSPVDGWTLESGANLFRGRPDTRFGVLRHDSNFYASVRYSY